MAERGEMASEMRYSREMRKRRDTMDRRKATIE